MNWLSRDIRTEEDLNAFFLVHQNYINSNDDIVTIAAKIPGDLMQTLTGRLLSAITQYHLEFKKKEAEREWANSYNYIRHLLPEVDKRKDAFVAFYAHDYAFLSGRNARCTEDELHLHVESAIEAAQMTPEPVQSQLLGFICFNAARTWVRELGSIIEQHRVQPESEQEKLTRMGSAFELFIHATEKRRAFYLAIRDSDDAHEIETAGRQLWRCSVDLRTLFPAAMLEERELECLLFNDPVFLEVEKYKDPKFVLPPSPAV